ncbi:MAG TPA: C1 family peptidase [Vicinamibacterales bacterium]|jgi:hypothetical protein|nr:C1 family peptidase [Vicinamibacterales bacterium]
MPKSKFKDRLFDARPDRLDLRDFPYRPPLRNLPPEYPEPAALKRSFPKYASDKMVLDQGKEGACTGFGLAAVVNYLRWSRIRLAKGSGRKAPPPKVSTRMLYHLARFYDEWPGEDYDGSSCRGALKGWHRHGVCDDRLWPYRNKAGEVVFLEPSEGWDANATHCPIGVYYRIDKRSVVDMQAAICEVGAIYCSGNVHAGWFASPFPQQNGIAYINAAPGAENTGGHAFALVGYNRYGFIVQNSWGPKWGTKGFAILPYADWVARGTDAWAVVLGAPIEHAESPHYHETQTLSARASAGDAAVALAGPPMAAVSAAVTPWDRDNAYRHAIVMGNNGALINRNISRQALSAFEHVVVEAPIEWCGSGPGRVLLYAHGGLNAEEESVKRIQVMAPYFKANGVYPIFLTWRTGVLESLKGIFQDIQEGVEPTGAFRDVLRVVKDTVGEARDRAVEVACQTAGVKAIWSQMKQNARAAQMTPQPVAGVDGKVAQHDPTLVLLADALGRLKAKLPRLEVHLLGHSAGSILFGHLLDALRERSLAVDSCTLYAPACTVQFALDHYEPAMTNGVLRKQDFHVELLSDERELGDTVGPYGKSLLYLVSRALEDQHKTPILGMAHAWDPSKRSTWTDDPVIQRGLKVWQTFWGTVRSPREITETQISNGVDRLPSSHGGFDNDVAVLTRTLERIAGRPLKHPVEQLVY